MGERACWGDTTGVYLVPAGLQGLYRLCIGSLDVCVCVCVLFVSYWTHVDYLGHYL